MIFLMYFFEIYAKFYVILNYVNSSFMASFIVPIQVTDLDVTNGGLAVSCDTRGSFKIWQSNNGEVRV